MKMRANRRADRREYDLLLLTFPDSQTNALNKVCASPICAFRMSVPSRSTTRGGTESPINLSPMLIAPHSPNVPAILTYLVLDSTIAAEVRMGTERDRARLRRGASIARTANEEQPIVNGFVPKLARHGNAVSNSAVVRCKIDAFDIPYLQTIPVELRSVSAWTTTRRS